MRTYGEIGGVDFVRQGFSIYNLATEYRLSYQGETSTVYVNNMAELKDEIRKLSGGCIDEQQDQIQVLPMHDNR